MAYSIATHFQNVSKMALFCSLIDERWHKTVEIASDVHRQARVILQTRSQLDALAGSVDECSELRLKNVQVCHNNEVRQGTLLIGFEKGASIVFPRKETEFYLLYGNGLHHIHLKPQSTLSLTISNGFDALIWKLTTKQLKELASKDWSNSFITAQHSWDYIIPLPILPDG